MNYLWKFHWNCGRQGSVNGLFVATEEEVNNLIGKDVYFGEILGKHSEIYGKIEDGEVTKVDLDSETVEKVAKILGETWSGYNPLHYMRYHCPICGDTVESYDFNFERNMCESCVEEEKAEMTTK